MRTYRITFEVHFDTADLVRSATVELVENVDAPTPTRAITEDAAEMQAVAQAVFTLRWLCPTLSPSRTTFRKIEAVR